MMTMKLTVPMTSMMNMYFLIVHVFADDSCLSKCFATVHVTNETELEQCYPLDNDMTRVQVLISQHAMHSSKPLFQLKHPQ